METVFIFSLFMIFYIYLGYPAIISLMSLMNNKEPKKSSFEPTVTILIAAYNEEGCIKNTIENKLNLDYPKEKLELIVISDESTDNTDKIVKSFKARGVRLLRQSPRRGKTSALNLAVPEAKGEVLVFSDANSLYAPNALKMLVQNFSDSSVGYVTGKMVYTNPDGSTIGDGCSAYMKYENFLRKIETKVGSIVGVDGGIDAVRKALYQPMKPDQLPDFVLPLKVIQQGFRVVYEREAILKEPTLKNTEDEYSMRVRVSLRALWALNDMRKLLSIRRYGLFAWQLWSHKALRYLCFIFLAASIGTNCFIWSEKVFYKFTFLSQLVVYLGAILSPLLEKKGRKFRIFYLFHYFALLNLASAHACIKFALRRKQAVWSPRKG